MIKGGYIPQIDKKPSECLFENRKICSSHNEIKYMKDFLAELNIDTENLSDIKVIDLLAENLEVKTEAEIWENKKFKEFVGLNKANNILKNIFKPKGPSNSVALLNNFNIDESLNQWSVNSEKLFGKKFYHIPFQMIDFMKVGSQLSKLNINELIKNEYDCFGVVLNTDVSTGGGKHWFCIYGDLRHKGTSEDPYVLEYFNSSGFPPMEQVIIWMNKVVHDLMKNYKKKCVIHKSANTRLQYSMTECGIWSLMYIKSRLEDHPSDWFYHVNASDHDMIMLRKHLFRKDKK